jgi:hypothetical protein
MQQYSAVDLNYLYIYLLSYIQKIHHRDKRVLLSGTSSFLKYLSINGFVYAEYIKCRQNEK